MLEFTVDAADLRGALQFAGSNKAGAAGASKTDCDVSLSINTPVTTHGFAFGSNDVQHTHGQFWREPFTGLLIGVSIGSGAGGTVIACPAQLVQHDDTGGMSWRVDIGDLRRAASHVKGAVLTFTATGQELQVAGERTTYQLSILDAPEGSEAFKLIKKVSDTFHTHKYSADHVAMCSNNDWFSSAADENAVDVGVIAVTSDGGEPQHCMIAMTNKCSVIFPVFPPSKRAAISDDALATPMVGDDVNDIMANICNVAASAQAQQNMPDLKGSQINMLRKLSKQSQVVRDGTLSARWLLRETFPISSLTHFKERSGSEGACYLTQQTDPTGNKYCVLTMMGKTGNTRAMSVFAPASPD